jgi:hypothetical protein
MTKGRIIHRPRTHHCNPGWTEYVISDSQIPELDGKVGLEPPATSIPDGAIWECECGRTWVAYHPQYRNIVVLSPSFRPEGRIERWRRQRKVAQ